MASSSGRGRKSSRSQAAWIERSTSEEKGLPRRIPPRVDGIIGNRIPPHCNGVASMEAASVSAIADTPRQCPRRVWRA